MPDDVPSGQYLALVREVATRHAIEWLTDDANAELLRTLRLAAAGSPDGPRSAIAILRFQAVQDVVPDGGFSLPAGPRLGLLCRMIETATAVIDWDKVAEAGLTFHSEGGK